MQRANAWLPVGVYSTENRRLAEYTTGYPTKYFSKGVVNIARSPDRFETDIFAQPTLTLRRKLPIEP